MKFIKPLLGSIMFLPMLVIALLYLLVGLLCASIFAIFECFIKDNQSHGRNNLNRFETVTNSFLDILKTYIQTAFCTKS